jgi:AraC family transcriptional regulator, regulatory protein of adaptative response / methylated-DNA-[protein]-cysteine methyltransferase
MLNALACIGAGRNRTPSPACQCCTRERTDMLDPAECDCARLARDPAYDGRFYTGVRTTGVYCRPVCPVRPAQSRNVQFFPSAAAAEAAGFRPCLRCRPETAPFSPAWNGSRTTVARGLRLILKGALDSKDATVGALAEKLGVGERHLVRLFTKHLDASPGQVAKTARVQRAKRLLDTTNLPMSAVALAAGFGSLRRFNAVVVEVYGRSPMELRRIRARGDPSGPGSIRETTPRSQLAPEEISRQ